MSDKRGKQFFKYLFRKIKAFLFSKDALTFLLFLLLSSTFWFVHAINKNRDTHVVIPVRYINIPNDILITNASAQEIRLHIKDQGKSLFSYSKKRLLPLNIDLSQAREEKGIKKITSDQLHVRLASLLRPTTSIISFFPDSIVVNYEKLASIELPIELNISIEPAQQYILSDSIWIYPTKVTVFGKRETLDTLSSIKTVHQELKEINKPTNTTLSLVQPQEANLSISEIEVKVNVEMFTERKIQLPVLFLNEPQGFILKSFPAFINVTYNIAVSDYNTELDNVQLFVDYKDIQRNYQEKIKVKAVPASSKIFNIRLVPEEIEFIIEETTQP